MSDLFYRNVRALSMPVLSAWFGLRVQGVENLPSSGACLVVANHVSYLDPAVLGRACDRKVHFLIRQAVYETRGLRWFFRRMDSIPVSDDVSDTSSLRAALKVLAAGRVVGIFPEGARSLDGDMADGKLGAALLATRTACPVVPAGIRGAHQAMPVGAVFPRPRRIEVVFGRPFTVPPISGRGKKQRLEVAAERIMVEIRDLADAEALPSAAEMGP